MKIALLNLPVDNNYGGMLQRFALMAVLRNQGHDVIHLNMRFAYNNGSLFHRCVRDAKRLLLRVCRKYDGPIMPEYRAEKQYRNSCKATDSFYCKYLNHTRRIVAKSALWPICSKMDAIVVGSDQVWRKTIAATFGISTYFCDFVPVGQMKLFAYGVSLGVENSELNEKEIKDFSGLYKRFNAVSVREESGCKLLDSYGWNIPEHVQVLDPTLLLDKECYCKLIDCADTYDVSGSMLCYILDKSEEKTKLINKKAQELGLKPFYLSIDGTVSVEQWLRSFRDAEYVITDSYHGLVFSIIMEKSFYLFRNEFRGNARFDSLLNTCGITNTDDIDWYDVRARLDFNRDQSIFFLKQSLS